MEKGIEKLKHIQNYFRKFSDRLLDEGDGEALVLFVCDSSSFSLIGSKLN